MKRLHPSTLGELQATVDTPNYDRAGLRAGIVHLGLGAFHRAHQAVYTDDAIRSSGGDWGIIGVSMRSAAVAEQLRPQQGLYSVLSEDANASCLRVIGAVVEVLVAPEQPAAVVAAIARQDIAVLTLTITEKGYALAADGKSLDVESAAIAQDLRNPRQPRSAIGLLALGLHERLAAGGASLTLLSCDNLSGNSTLLRAVLVEYLGTTFPAVLPWLDTATTFPCSMVDRIVPAMTTARLQRQAQQLGLLDEGAVSTEPFSQWIIEDNFAAGRPDWTSAGAQLVSDIAPFETMKLQMLNAAHSAIAYCGLLAGLETVDEVVADAVLGKYIERLMFTELLPAVSVPSGFDLAAYATELLARFGNPCLQHRCAQIAMDGSEKISQRWLPTLQQAVEQPLLVHALSAWCYFLLYSEQPIEDPREARLVQLRGSDAPVVQRLIDLLACARITPETLDGFEQLLRTVESELEVIASCGVSALLAP